MTAKAYTSDQFVTTWKTDNTSTGSSNSTSIKIPLGNGYTYNFQVDWTCDGTYDTTFSGAGSTINATHDYGTAGTYQVCIGGTFPQIWMGGTGTDKLKLLSVDNWGSGAWLNVSGAFQGASNMDVKATDTPNLTSVTDLNSMFNGASSLVGNSSFNTWDVSNVTDMSNTFSNAKLFNQDLNSWDTRKVTTFVQMFASASAFNGNITSWEIPAATNITLMFSGATAFNQDISTKIGGGNKGGTAWNISNINSLFAIFLSASSFNQNIGNWNTSNVTNLTFTFSGANAFNQNIGNWDTSKVTTMSQTFSNAFAFNQNIGNWDTSKVTSMQAMFSNAFAFNQDITGWKTELVTDMSSMFKGTKVFNQSLSTWKTQNVTTMSSMFEGALLADPDLGSWNVSKVTTFERMFFAAKAINHDISNWKMIAPGGVNLSWMFFLASAYNQNLGSLNMSNVRVADRMLSNTALSQANYDATLTGWSYQTLNNGVVFDAHGLKYCAARNDRQAIIDEFAWTSSSPTNPNSTLFSDSLSCTPTITFNAPTKLKNSPITDSTVRIFYELGITPSNVALVGTNASNLNCTQTTSQQLDCTVSVNTTGSLQVRTSGLVSSTTATTTATEAGYIIDTIPPSTPSIGLNTAAGINNPTVTFSSTDNIAVDHYELVYVDASGVQQTILSASSPTTLSLYATELTVSPFYHTITVRAYDTAGNMSSNSIKFPPIVSFNTPTPLSKTTITDATVTVTSPAGNTLQNITLALALQEQRSVLVLVAVTIQPHRTIAL